MKLFLSYLRKLSYFSVFVLFVFALNTSLVQAVPPTDGLISHWLLNEGSGATANDSNANNNDGAINGASWDGSTLVFDGSNDYVNLGALDISGDALTLSAKVMSSQLTNCGSRDCRIISKATGVGSSDHYWMLSTISSGGATKLRYRLRTNGTTHTLISGASGEVVDNELFHVVATYDGSHMRLYKNGTEVGSKAVSGDIETNNGVEAWIGGNPDGATIRPWKGTISDVLIYNKALSVTEISQLSNSCTVNSFPGALSTTQDEIRLTGNVQVQGTNPLITKNVAENWMSTALETAIQDQTPSKENFIKSWRLWEKNLVGNGTGAKGYFPLTRY